MPRRRKHSVVEDVMDLVSRLPWWVGVAMAVVSYLAIGSLANRALPTPGVAGQSDAIVTAAMVKALATPGQYIVPGICLFGAVGSALRRRKRKQLVADVVHARSSDPLNGMRWQEFELLVGEAFRQQGFQVVESGGGGADGGIDLVLSKPVRNGREKYLVQCKQWRANKVGVDVVRELYGAMAATGAAGGFVVTSGRFTDQARGFAQGRNIQLIEGAELTQMMRGASGVQPATESPAPSPPAKQITTAGTPHCPLCSQPMVLRKARRGANTGSSFWGCAGYPTCRGTRSE